MYEIRCAVSVAAQQKPIIQMEKVRGNIKQKQIR
jgi:hypothetical protein